MREKELRADVEDQWVANMVTEEEAWKSLKNLNVE